MFLNPCTFCGIAPKEVIRSYKSDLNVFSFDDLKEVRIEHSCRVDTPSVVSAPSDLEAGKMWNTRC